MKHSSINIGTWIASAVLGSMLSGCLNSDASLPEITVHKSASCECCKVWAQHLRHADFRVVVRNTDDLDSIKERLGISGQMRSCHTAEVAGYFVEGHVPVDDIKRLLRERPSAKGLAVPGMPAGSPGMEVTSGRAEPYDVLLVESNDDAGIFTHHGDQGVSSN